MAEEIKQHATKIDPELFKLLDSGLREVLELSTKIHEQRAENSHEHIHGRTAAKAAAILMKLHMQFDKSASSVQNIINHRPMESGLFETVNENLRSIFSASVNYLKEYGSNDHKHVHGLAAAEAADSLIKLHATFKPKR